MPLEFSFPSNPYILSTGSRGIAWCRSLPLIWIPPVSGESAPTRGRASAAPSRGRSLLIFLAGSRRMEQCWLLLLIQIPPARGRAAPSRGRASTYPARGRSSTAPERGRASLVCLAHSSSVIYLFFKSLYMPTLQKISTIDFRCNFVGSFFCVCVPDIIGKSNNNKKCQSEQDVNLVLYSEMDGQQFQNKEYGDTVPKKHVACAYVIFRSILKSAPGAVQYCGIRVDYLSKTKFPLSCKFST